MLWPSPLKWNWKTNSSTTHQHGVYFCNACWDSVTLLRLLICTASAHIASWRKARMWIQALACGFKPYCGCSSSVQTCRCWKENFKWCQAEADGRRGEDLNWTNALHSWLLAEMLPVHSSSRLFIMLIVCYHTVRQWLQIDHPRLSLWCRSLWEANRSKATVLGTIQNIKPNWQKLASGKIYHWQ